MMFFKKFRMLIALVVVLGLAVGGYFLAKNHNSSKSGPDASAAPGDTSVALITVDKETIDSVTLTDGKDTFVIRKKDKDFVLEQPSDLKVDKDRPGSVAATLSSLSADKVVDENTSDVNQYGFDKPYKIDLLAKDTKKSIEIGSMNATKDGYYVREAGQNKIYLVSTYTVESLKLSRMSLLAKTFYELKAEDVQGVTLQRDGQVMIAAKKTSDTNWAMTAPIEANASQDAVTQLTDAATKLGQAKDIVEEKAADMAKYGLDKPAYVLSFTAATGSHSIAFGAVKEKGVRYATIDASKMVFLADETNMVAFDKPLKELVDIFVYIVNINDVSKMTLQLDGKTTVAEIQTDEKDKEKDKFTVNGKDATMKNDKDEQPFRKFYQAAIGLTVDEVDTTGNPSIGTADLTLTYVSRKDNSSMKVELVKADDKTYYVFRNGKYAHVKFSAKRLDGDEGLRVTLKTMLDALK